MRTRPTVLVSILLSLVLVAAACGDSDEAATDPTTGQYTNGQYTAITAGGAHSCALKTDNTITCWGDNGDGQADPPSQQNGVTQ